jgi:two-component system KDP operon response regulator KdpE
MAGQRFGMEADQSPLREPVILAIDDEPGILRMIKLELGSQGLQVITATSGADGLRMVRTEQPDLALVDIIMPAMSGLEVLTELKATSGIPVILLTAKDTEEDRLRGLALGADDYIAKPFRPEDLTERVRAALRRNVGESAKDQLLRIGPLEIDLSRHLVWRKGQVVPLTPTEWKLLEQLAMRAGTVVANEHLLSAVWGAEYREDVQYLGIWITRLQRKLEDDPTRPRMISAHEKQGYELRTFEPDAAKPNIA